jgi:hypothetical protein
MSVEQTTQLIQLILNSVLMTITCALLLGRAETRQAIAAERLQIALHHYDDLLELSNLAVASPETSAFAVEPVRRTSDNRLLQAKKNLRQLQHRYKLSHRSWLALHYALLFSIISTFSLALRSLFYLEWLIPLALAAFVIGVSVLLLGVVLTLCDLHLSDLSLWEELQEMLHPGKSDPSSRLGQRSRQPGIPTRSPSQTTGTKLRSSPRARLG